MINKFKLKTKIIKKEAYTLYLVYQNSQISLWKRLFLGVVIGYAFCPIDLIPDFIPILGYIDDLILVPLGLSIALKLIPKEIYEECRKRANEEDQQQIPIGKKTGIIIIFIWIVGLGVLLIWFLEILAILLVS